MHGEKEKEQRSLGGETPGKENIWKTWEQMGIILKSILKELDGKELSALM